MTNSVLGRLRERPPMNNGLHPGGRPALLLTEDQLHIIATMASHGVSQRIVAGSLELDYDTVYANKEFQSTYKRHFTKLQDRLACAQVAKALDQDNLIMQIWLGKQYLGQSDKADIKESSIQVNISIQVRAPSEAGKLLAAACLEGEGTERIVEGEVVRELSGPKEDKGS